MIRSIVAILFFATVSFSAIAQHAEVAAIKPAIASKDPGAINGALLMLKGAINKYELVDQSSIDKPSPARLKRKKELQEALKPIKSDLLALSDSNNDTLSRNALIIIGYGASDSDVYAQLSKMVRESDKASTALNSLYKMGAADQRVREIAVQRIAKFKDKKETSEAFDLLNLSAVWPLPEVLPVCIEMLKSDTPVSNKVIAANAIMKLGPAGEEALPELEKLLRELEQQGGDFRYINTVKRAITVVSGQGDVPQAVTPTAPAQPTPVSSTVSPVQKQMPSPTPTVTPEAKFASSIFWIVFTAIIAIIIVGVLVLLLRKK